MFSSTMFLISAETASVTQIDPIHSEIRKTRRCGRVNSAGSDSKDNASVIDSNSGRLRRVGECGNIQSRSSACEIIFVIPRSPRL